MSRIGQEWKTYVESVFEGQTIQKAQYQEMRRAFYVGAIKMLHILLKELDDLPPEEIKRVLDGLEKDVFDFLNEIRLKLEAKEEKNRSENV